VDLGVPRSSRGGGTTYFCIHIKMLRVLGRLQLLRVNFAGKHGGSSAHHYTPLPAHLLHVSLSFDSKAKEKASKASKVSDVQ
jgi:hypothetical protein